MTGLGFRGVTRVGSTVVPSDTAHFINSLVKATSSMFSLCSHLRESDSGICLTAR